MTETFHGSVVVVTGAASGLGQRLGAAPGGPRRAHVVAVDVDGAT